MTTIPVPLTRRERFKLVGFFVILFGLELMVIAILICFIPMIPYILCAASRKTHCKLGLAASVYQFICRLEGILLCLPLLAFYPYAI